MSGSTAKVKVGTIAKLFANITILCREWTLFYDNLSMQKNRRHDLEVEFARSNDSFKLFISILEQWVGEKGTNATVESLASVLDDIHHRDAAEKLLQNYGGAFVSISGDIEKSPTTEAKSYGVPLEPCGTQADIGMPPIFAPAHTMIVVPTQMKSHATQTSKAFANPAENEENKAVIEEAQTHYIQCLVDLEGAKRLRKWIEDNKNNYTYPVLKDILTGILGKTSNPAKMFELKFDETRYFQDLNSINVEIEAKQILFNGAVQKLNEAKNSY